MKGGNFSRRDRLVEMQRQAQKIWATERRFERNEDPTRPKYMVTFPYPYSNGRLHLGHGFSFSKTEFMSRFKTMTGYNSLLPFGFHCTGMPISAAAKRLQGELTEYGEEQLKKWALDEDCVENRPEKKTQYEILYKCEVDAETIPKFVDAKFWTKYFPPRGREDLEVFGACIDWRRSFITTDANPYYDQFIKWQFNKLKQGGFLKFGKRASIFSVKDDQMCADHDRSEGEGVGPQEYTLIKLQLDDPVKRAEITKDTEVTAEDDIFFVAATLRPETMYGQTNFFVKPDGDYGMFRMKNGEVWVCSDQSALGMSYQEMFPERGKPVKVGSVKGETIICTRVKAPLSHYPHVYCLPMLSISMGKGTGVVTSVPSDSPDDYAVLIEFKKKKAFREKYGLTDEMVLPFDPIEIIEIPGYSRLSAEKAYKQYKVKSMNDKKKLERAKEDVYSRGFYAGEMLVGEHVKMKVQDAKPLVKAMMIEANQAATYYEPEKKVVSRSGDECVVALCDQWYLNYGQQEQKERLKKYVNSDQFETYTKVVQNEFIATLDWLKEWGCSRSFGLGTRMPWDEQYLIESLSDSTLYMSYYTVAHYLQSDLNGAVPGTLGIPSADIRDEEFDYIFLGIESGLTTSKVPREKLDTLRGSFKYWYPNDLRCSGKDLIKNHLTMSLYNHEYVFNTFAVDKETTNYLPGGYFCNGYVNIDQKKMSKSEGNFYTLRELVDRSGADAVRMVLAGSGDTLEDANFVMKDLDNAILKLTTLDAWMKDTYPLQDTMRTESCEETQFYDDVFRSEINELALNTRQAYESMQYRQVMVHGFFNFISAKEDYLINVGHKGMRRDLFLDYLKKQILLLAPIIPHFSEILCIDYLIPLCASGAYGEELKQQAPKDITDLSFPDIKIEDIDLDILTRYRYILKVASSVRASYNKLKQKKKHEKIASINIVVAPEFRPWQKLVMEYFEDKTLVFNEKGRCTSPVWAKDLKKMFTGEMKPKMKKSMQFASHLLSQYPSEGVKVFDSKVQMDESALLVEYKGMILRDMQTDLLLNIKSSQNLSKEDTSKISKFLGSCVPGTPYIYFDFN